MRLVVLPREVAALARQVLHNTLTLRSIFFKGKIVKVSVVSGSVEPEAIVQVKVKCSVPS